MTKATGSGRSISRMLSGKPATRVRVSRAKWINCASGWGPGATREGPQTNAPYPDFDPAASAAVWGPGPVLLGSAHRQSQRAGAGLGVAPEDGRGCGSRTRRAMSAEQTGWFRGTPLRPAITWPALPPARKGIPLRRARCAARPVSGRHRPDRARADRRNSPGWRCVPRSRGSRGC